MADTSPFEFSEELLNQLRYYIQDNNTVRVGRSLKKMLFDYIRYHHDHQDVNFGDILNDIENIIEFIEVISDETKNWRRG